MSSHHHRIAEKRTGARVVLCIACAVIGCGDVGLVGGQTSDDETTREATGNAQRQIVLGMSFPEGFASKDPHEEDMIAALDRLAQPVSAGGVGHYPATAAIWINFASGGWSEGPRDTFPRERLLDALHERRITPVIFLTPVGPELSREHGDPAAARKYSNQAIANGAWDDYLRAFARAAAAWGKPIILRYAWEMNGSWFPWGVHSGNRYWPLGNNAANYKAAWRHVRKLIRSRAPKVKFLWCPFGTERTTTKSIARWFPGTEHVDYIGVDVYEARRSDRSMVELYRPSIRALRGLDIPRRKDGTSKIPILIGETGILHRMPNRVRWLAEGYPAVYQRFGDVKAILYFNYDVTTEGRNWALAAGKDMRRAYAKLANRHRFQGRFAPYKGAPPSLEQPAPTQQQPAPTQQQPTPAQQQSAPTPAPAPDQPEPACIPMGVKGCSHVGQCCGTGTHRTCGKAGKCCKTIGGMCKWNVQCCAGNCSAGRCVAN